MSKGNTQIVSSGVSTAGLLGIVFVVLKLLGVISWSWWLVLLPFYFGLAVVLVVFAVFTIGVTLFGIGYLVYLAAKKASRK